MTDFTRLTVIGSARRAELVVPDDEALGGLLPRLMELLNEPTGPVARPLALVRVTGEQVDAALTAAEQQLADGEQLRLVRADDAPPPPEVADVTDVVGDSFVDRRGRWSTPARQGLAAVTIGAGCCVALLVRPLTGTTGLALIALLCVAAVIFGRAGGLPATSNTGNTALAEAGRRAPVRRWPVIACTAAAAGMAVPVARSLLTSGRFGPLSAPLDAAPGGSGLVWAAVAALLIWVVLGVGAGVGLRVRPAAPGAVIGAGLIALPLALAAGGLRPDRAVVIAAVAAVVVCGLLPWYALTTSGLTGLDDQVLAGRPSRRRQVVHTVDDAYRTLSWSAMAVALPLGVGAALLVRSDNRWFLLLGLLVITITALRTRAFPLIVQQLPLGLAAVLATVVAVLSQRPHLSAGAEAGLLLALAAVTAVGAGVVPAAHQRARLRRLGNLIEAIAVVALAPLVLGAFGVFTDLIGAFR